MRYLLFALALLGSISLVTVPTMTYADGTMPNGKGGEGKTSQTTTGGHADPDCGKTQGGTAFGEDC